MKKEKEISKLKFNNKKKLLKNTKLCVCEINERNWRRSLMIMKRINQNWMKTKDLQKRNNKIKREWKVSITEKFD